jgi:hypothetical protein
MLGIRQNRASILPTVTVAVVLLLLLTTGASAKGPVVHHVSVGGPDNCIGLGAKVGCDANFSLVANQYADGSVSGQWSDNSAYLASGAHVVIDCLVVDGNEAWVSGVIVKGALLDGTSLVGLPVGARLRDNGSSANDPPDQFSFAYPGDPTPCTEKPDYELFDAPQGQVQVR